VSEGVETMKWQAGLVCALLVFGLAAAQSQVSPVVSPSENFQLGLKYEGEGAFPLAFLAYKRSGDSGNADGYLKIAKMYEEGHLGSGGDSEATGEQAVPWYQKAASSGNPEAQKWLASHSKLVQESALSTAAAESRAQSTAQAIAQTFTVRSVFISGDSCALSVRSEDGITYYASAKSWECSNMRTGSTLTGYVKSIGAGGTTQFYYENGVEKNGQTKWNWLVVSSQSQ
jgi:TPR repeat protein